MKRYDFDVPAPAGLRIFDESAEFMIFLKYSQQPTFLLLGICCAFSSTKNTCIFSYLVVFYTYSL